MIASPALRLTLDSDALVANWRWLAAQSGSAACGAAVKADGYGLGAKAVVERLAHAGCRDFFVATWDEAERLGPMPEGTALSVLHGVRDADLLAAAAIEARPVLNSPEQVIRWREAMPNRACDVMVDTGMNRLGLMPEQAVSGLLEGLRIETLMSHLACADEPVHPMNERQLGIFVDLRRRLAARRYSLANSAGICAGERYAFDLTRPGISLYGGIQRQEANGWIKAVVQPEAEVLQIRDLRPGDSVGYGATFTAPNALRIAILNLGYADGYLRCFARNGRAWAADGACPVLGRVSMDLIVVDVTGLDVAVGDWLRIDYELAATSAATGLSQYELLTGLGSRYQRRWI